MVPYRRRIDKRPPGADSGGNACFRKEMNVANAPQVTIIGGGMITQVQLLPTIYHLQREGLLGDVHICALNAPPLKALQDDPTLVKGFPGQSFKEYMEDWEYHVPKRHKEFVRRIARSFNVDEHGAARPARAGGKTDGAGAAGGEPRLNAGA